MLTFKNTGSLGPDFGEMTVEVLTSTTLAIRGKNGSSDTFDIVLNIDQIDFLGKALREFVGKHRGIPTDLPYSGSL